MLCATDLRTRSERAVSRADVIARGLGAQLLLLHVVDTAGSARASGHRGARARFVLDVRARKPRARAMAPKYRFALVDRIKQSRTPRSSGMPISSCSDLIVGASATVFGAPLPSASFA